jgi:hypothetical protein
LLQWDNWTYLSGSPGSELLGPRAGVPLLNNTSLLEGLLDGSGSSGSGEGSDGVRGEDEVSVSDSLSGDGGGGAVNESLDVSTGLCEVLHGSSRYDACPQLMIAIDLRPIAVL